MSQAQSGTAQVGRGQNHDTTITAMPNEALVVHVPDPEANRILTVNDIKETRYAKVISVGRPTGRHPAPSPLFLFYFSTILFKYKYIFSKSRN